jgi:hypothetical protein
MSLIIHAKCSLLLEEIWLTLHGETEKKEAENTSETGSYGWQIISFVLPQLSLTLMLAIISK